MNAYRLHPPLLCQSSYFVSALVQANTIAKCRQPLGLSTPVSLKSESVGAKVLRYIIEWVKCTPLFLELSQNDKENIIASSWFEIFVLVTAQYNLLPELSKSFASSFDNYDEEKAKILRHFETEVGKCRFMDCDQVEIECLKAIVLYNSGKKSHQKSINGSGIAKLGRGGRCRPGPPSRARGDDQLWLRH